MKNRLGIAMAGLILAAAGSARAQEPAFGERGHLAISAERLFGYVHATETQSGAGGASHSIDTFSFATNPAGASSWFSWPRIGLDFFAAKNLSLGASLGYFRTTQDAPGGTETFSGFAVAPRIGYALALGSKVAFWPRAGVTYERVALVNPDPAIGTDQTSKTSLFALTVEAPLAILVVPRAAILLGPTLDLGLAGSDSGGGSTIDAKFTDLAFEAGLLLFL